MFTPLHTGDPFESNPSNPIASKADGDRRTQRSSLFIRVLFLVVIGLLLSLLICLFQWLREEQAKLLFIGLDGMNRYLALGAGSLLVVVIVCWRLRPSPKSLGVTFTALLLLGFVATRVFRIDGYYGNRTPRITWSWSPSAELELKNYLASKRKASTPSNPFDALISSNQASGTETTEGNFCQLMGNDRQGKIDNISLKANWQESVPKQLWRHPVGLGWSSFSVVGNAAVTLEQRGDFECVVCYDTWTGIEVWCHQERARFDHEYGGGPRSTPTIQNGFVFSMGATGLLTCVDLKSGQLVWKQSVFSDPASENLIFGMTGSPIVVNDLVVVTPGAGQGGHAIAYSASTGAEAWRSGDDEASYASPVAISLCQELQILSFNGAGLRSYSLTGKPLWLVPWVTQGESRVNVAQPIIVSSDESVRANGSSSATVLISSGYDKGTALVKITHSEDQWTTEIVWESKLLKTKLSNIVVHNHFVYGLDNGILACLDVNNGQRAWKGGRYGHGKLMLVGEHLLIQAESGEIILVAATSDGHRELGKFQALSSKTWNHFALAGKVLLVRNDREAAAYQLETELPWRLPPPEFTNQGSPSPRQSLDRIEFLGRAQ